MGLLFISHAKEDNSRALKVRDWLRDKGWQDVFLDIDPNTGIAPGQRWQDELKRAGERCEAVIVLISPSWLASRWCQTEFLVADQLGKKILPIIVVPTSIEALPLELRAKFQLADISSPENESVGFQNFAIGLRRAGLDPNSFPWPPPSDPRRSVFRGLKALDIDDAAIFFGRNAAIVRVLDELRRMRDQNAKRIFVILGGSGAGKSSFMRAGILARLLREDRDFLVLPVMRPGRAAMSGAGGLADTFAKAGAGGGPWTTPEAFREAFAKLRLPVVERWRMIAKAAGEDYCVKPPTIVIPIDQAEELVAPVTSEADSVLDLLAAAVDADFKRNLLVTVRTDSFEPLQRRWMPEQQVVFSLSPVAPSAFKEIIEGPAALATPPIALDPEMVEAVLSDLSEADALPLLAYTLERLMVRGGEDRRLSLQDYRDGLGGLTGGIQTAVAEVLGTSPRPEASNDARRLFIPALVRVSADGPTRRQADIIEIPRDLHRLAEQFVEKRLLHRNGSVLEITHEAILRHWPALAGWIAEERETLAALDAARASAREWRAAANATAWLVHRGRRLEDAQAVASQPSYAGQVEPLVKDYLNACQAIETREASSRLRLRVLAGTAELWLNLGDGLTDQAATTSA